MIEVGKKYRFDTKGTDSHWKAWDGKECTVIRPLTREEADIDDVGPMWRVRFDDKKHTETDAFDDELYGPFLPKIVLFSSSVAVSMIADLRYSDPDENGTKTGQYIMIATVMGRQKYVNAALIEDKEGLPEGDRGYRLHILNDIDERDGYFLETEHLDVDELASLLENLAYDLDHGRQ